MFIPSSSKPSGLGNPTAILRALSLDFLNHRTVKNKVIAFLPLEVAWEAAWLMRGKPKKRAHWLLGDLCFHGAHVCWHRPFPSVWLEGHSTHFAALSQQHQDGRQRWHVHWWWAEGRNDQVSWMTRPAGASLGFCHLRETKLYCFRFC